ncbi:sensor histidine kinase [Tessaracoccus sp. OH4464_COT-324]|uniref:sensor histidine kinase n=1 Tax=Tessaracoccus sp. OH4464_COT-324 TaxID=2491059 RepID=UPI001319E0CA|nr:sensor histidine kinase [Tessaracoccus sp. OH4464_COT-324]
MSTSQSRFWGRASTGLALFSLIYLFYPVREIYLLDVSWAWRALGWTQIAVFAALYVVGWTRPGDLYPPAARKWLAARCVALAALACSLIPLLGTGALWLTAYLLAVSTFGLWRPWRWIVSCSLMVLAGLPSWLAPDSDGAVELLIYNLNLLVTFTLITEVVIRADGWEKAERHALVLEERNRMARDVHDLLGHSLTVVNLKAQLAERLLDKAPEQSRAELAQIREITSAALDDVRQTVTSARTATVVEELDHARDTLESAGVEVIVEGEPESLTPPVSLVAGWILKEATTNVLRHAAATRCRLVFKPRRLAISDDGCGLGETEHGGLKGMRERVAAAGGRLVLERSDLGGAHVEVTW